MLLAAIAVAFASAQINQALKPPNQFRNESSPIVNPVGSTTESPDGSKNDEIGNRNGEQSPRTNRYQPNGRNGHSDRSGIGGEGRESECRCPPPHPPPPPRPRNGRNRRNRNRRQRRRQNPQSNNDFKDEGPSDPFPGDAESQNPADAPEHRRFD